MNVEFKKNGLDFESLLKIVCSFSLHIWDGLR